MANRIAGVLLVLVGITSLLPAQPPDQRPNFEAVSVNPSTTIGRPTTSWNPTELRTRNTTLRSLIQMAFQVRDFQTSGGPGWINSEQYDVIAKSPAALAEGRATKESRLKLMAEMSLMLQGFLEDRFKLKFHRETRELPVYALTVAKGGVKMRRSKETSCASFDWSRNDPPAGETPVIHCAARETGPNILLNHTLDAEGISISAGSSTAALPASFFPDLTTFLSNHLDRFVIDKSGLTGLFDLHLEWSLQATADPTSADEFTNPSIFTALREQLGLQLESATGPVEVLVIDHAEKPSEN
jgi:uncharacterized protein (TIGR03435 family)